MIRRYLTCKLKCSFDNHQANLVSLHSEEEQQFVVGLNGGFPWLGGRRDPGNRDTWVWSDGTPWDYNSSWASGEPNNLGGEDCVQTWTSYGSQWNDLACGRVLTFICKKGKNHGQV